MCAKHIIAAGIKKLIFLEPIQKALRRSYTGMQSPLRVLIVVNISISLFIECVHFYGVSPRRYL